MRKPYIPPLKQSEVITDPATGKSYTVDYDGAPLTDQERASFLAQLRQAAGGPMNRNDSLSQPPAASDDPTQRVPGPNYAPRPEDLTPITLGSLPTERRRYPFEDASLVGGPRAAGLTYPGAELWSAIGQAPVNFAKGFVASGLQDYNGQDDASPDWMTNVGRAVGRVFNPVGIVPRLGAGLDAAVFQNGGQRVGEAVPALDPHTLGGAAYDLGTGIAGDALPFTPVGKALRMLEGTGPRPGGPAPGLPGGEIIPEGPPTSGIPQNGPALSYPAGRVSPYDMAQVDVPGPSTPPASASSAVAPPLAVPDPVARAVQRLGGPASAEDAPGVFRFTGSEPPPDAGGFRARVVEAHQQIRSALDADASPQASPGLSVPASEPVGISGPGLDAAPVRVPDGQGGSFEVTVEDVQRHPTMPSQEPVSPPPADWRTMRTPLGPQVGVPRPDLVAPAVGGESPITTPLTLPADPNAVPPGLVDPNAAGQFSMLTNAAPEPTKAQQVYRQAMDTALQAAGVPMALNASGDLSAPLRQGLVLGLPRPRAVGRSLVDMIKAIRSPQSAAVLDAQISTRPNAPLYDEFGLHFNGPEEQFTDTNAAQRLPFLGPMIRGSDRAYSAYLNRLRVEAFDQADAAFRQSGLSPEANPGEYKALAGYINTASGRGDLGALSKYEDALRLAMFSPRFQASRLQLMNPLYYAGLPPATRQLAMRDMATTAGAVASLLAVAKAGGADVETDPRSPDFGQIKVDRTRVDLTGGFRPWMVFFSQMASGQRKNPMTGEFSEVNPIARAAEEGRKKLNPLASYLTDALVGSDFRGQKFDPNARAVQALYPLYVQDAQQAMASEGWVKGGLLSVPGLFGAGMTTYADDAPETRLRPRPAVRDPFLTPSLATPMPPEQADMLDRGFRTAPNRRGPRYLPVDPAHKPVFSRGFTVGGWGAMNRPDSSGPPSAPLDRNGGR